MGHRRISRALIIILAAFFVTGCGKKEEPKPPVPKGFEDFTSNVENRGQVFAKKDDSAASDIRAMKVGVIASKTGDDAAIGLKTIKGVELAAEAFNASGGVNGERIEVVTVDDEGDPEAAKKALKRLTDEKVVAIIGAPTGWATLVPVYVSTETKTVFVSAGTRRHIGSSGPFSFRVSLPIESASERLISHAMSEGRRTFFLASFMEEDSLNVAGAFRRAAHKLGGEVKGQGNIFTGADMPAAVSDLKKAMPVDAVIFAGPASGAAEFARQARKAGMDRPIMGGEELMDDEFLKTAEAAGTVIYASFSPGDPGAAAFVEAYRKKNGKTPDAVSAAAYDTFMIIGAAIKEAGAPDTRKVRDTLMKVERFKGVTGEITIDSGREAKREPHLLKAVKSGGGLRFTPVQAAR